MTTLIDRLEAGPWPKWGPEFNRWNIDAAGFLALVLEAPLMWAYDPPLKYLELRVDMRSGHFILKDRDGNTVEPDRVIQAALKAREKTDG